MSELRELRIDYSPPPTVARFMHSNAFVRGLMGPVGSAKTTACIFEIFRRAQMQPKARDGIRYSRWLIVRNTGPELETTTMKSWFQWFPPDTKMQKAFGVFRQRPPLTHFVRVGDIDLEVIFLALDRDEDKRKLLSFECTGIWFNEAREMDYSIVQMALTRVGRYPNGEKGGCAWNGIIMDTNPPDDQHWWYHMFEETRPDGWELFKQPSGLASTAENLENLNQTEHTLKLPLEERRAIGRGYYERMMAGQPEEWVNVYVRGLYGFVQTGRAVYKHEWNDDFHCSKTELKPLPGLPVWIGVDCSGRNPAAVFLQKPQPSRWLAIRELVSEDISAKAFAQLLKSDLDTYFPGSEVYCFGDPAGGAKAQTREETYFDVLRSVGIRVVPATEGLRIEPRIQTVKQVLSENIEGSPRLMICPVNCKVLRKGFNGAYNYKKYSTSGASRFDTTPDKRDNRHADVHDALQYGLVGAGEARTMRGRPETRNTQIVIQDPWRVF